MKKILLLLCMCFSARAMEIVKEERDIWWDEILADAPVQQDLQLFTEQELEKDLLSPFTSLVVKHSSDPKKDKKKLAALFHVDGIKKKGCLVIKKGKVNYFIYEHKGDKICRYQTPHSKVYDALLKAVESKPMSYDEYVEKFGESEFKAKL